MTRDEYLATRKTMTPADWAAVGAGPGFTKPVGARFRVVDRTASPAAAAKGKRREKTTPRPPCVFLGEPTGKRHKVGCGDRYLDEYFCRCSQREVVEIKSRKGTQSKVLTPKAIPRGRCRDLEIYRGAVAACVDCPLYRAGLLPGPTAQENAGPGHSLEGS